MAMAFRGLGALNPNFPAVGNGMPAQLADPLVGLPMAQISQPQPSRSIAPQMPQLTDASFDQRIQPKPWAHGGKAWDTVGAISDALSAMGGRGTPYHNSQLALGEQALANQFKQQQLMIEAWKARQGNRTPFQNNYEYLQGLGRPKDAEAFLANTVDPVTLTTDPTTGMLTSLHKSGAPVARSAAGIPEGTRMTINGKDAWYVNGDWYDNPEGR